jgi:hypothetical protein
MEYFQLEPEVAGGWGGNTQADTSVHPPVVTKLHYEFDGWLGDSILETFPCFIVTVDLGNALSESNLTGFSLESVEISKSEQFVEFYPERELPEFFWLKIGKNAGLEDFGINDQHRLVISSSALEVLQKFGLDNCEIEQYG